MGPIKTLIGRCLVCFRWIEKEQISNVSLIDSENAPHSAEL